MKDRLHIIVRTQLALAAIGVAFALTLGGCSGSNSGDSAAGGGSGAATAQDAGGAGGAGSAASGRHWMAKALASLGLSDDQKSKIRGIMSDARKQSAGADPATRRANFRAAMAKIDAVLTPDQRTKLDEMRKERQQGAKTQS